MEGQTPPLEISGIDPALAGSLAGLAHSIGALAYVALDTEEKRSTIRDMLSGFVEQKRRDGATPEELEAYRSALGIITTAAQSREQIDAESASARQS